MKTLLSLTASLAMAALLVPTSALAVGSGAGITGSPHDFSAATWNSSGEICRVCHIPHDHGSTNGTGGLLWSRTTTSSTFQMYSAAPTNFLDGAMSAQPDGVSKLCLSCHDDTVALSQFSENVDLADVPNSDTTTTVSGVDPAAVIPQLTDGSGNPSLIATHPISVIYDPAADAGNLLNPQLAPETAIMGTSGTVIGDVLEGWNGTAYSATGKVQCSSCHDVHDKEAVANTHLLRVNNSTLTGGSASGLCLTCHLK